VVIGAVGSGKSSLLYSILDEVHMVKGKKQVRGSIAYVEQEPFIVSASVLDNITMGRPLDEKLLDEALSMSQLKRDMPLL